MARSEPVQSLSANPRFRRFWLGRFLASTAQNAILLALLVTVVNRTGSTLHSSLLILSFVLPAALLGVAGGVLVDHLPRRGLLVLSCLLRALLCAVFLKSNESVWLIYATNLTLSALTQIAGPAESALVPELVEGEQVASATALLNVGIIGAQVMGTVILAPLFLKTAGPDPLFFLSVMLFLGAAVAYSSRPVAAEPAAPRNSDFHGVRCSAQECWSVIRSSRLVFSTVVQLTLTTTTLLVLLSILPSFTRKVLGLPAENAVYVFAPTMLGVAAGNWVVPKLIRRSSMGIIAASGFAAFIVFLAVLGLSDHVAVALRHDGAFGPAGALAPHFVYAKATVAALIALPIGFAYAVVLVVGRLITYENVPAQMHGRVFAFQGVLSSLASIVPLLLVGVVTPLLGPGAMLVTIALIDLCALAYARLLFAKRSRPGELVAVTRPTAFGAE